MSIGYFHVAHPAGTKVLLPWPHDTASSADGHAFFLSTLASLIPQPPVSPFPLILTPQLHYMPLRTFSTAFLTKVRLLWMICVPLGLAYPSKLTSAYSSVHTLYPLCYLH